MAQLLNSQSYKAKTHFLIRKVNENERISSENFSQNLYFNSSLRSTDFLTSAQNFCSHTDEFHSI